MRGPSVRPNPSRSANGPTTEVKRGGPSRRVNSIHLVGLPSARLLHGRLQNSSNAPCMIGIVRTSDAILEGLGDRFLEEVQRVFDFIAAHPALGSHRKAAQSPTLSTEILEAIRTTDPRGNLPRRPDTRREATKDAASPLNAPRSRRETRGRREQPALTTTQRAVSLKNRAPSWNVRRRPEKSGGCPEKSGAVPKSRAQSGKIPACGLHPTFQDHAGLSRTTRDFSGR
jgi:hypothetical protein